MAEMKPQSRRAVYWLGILATIFLLAGAWDLYQVHRADQAYRAQTQLLHQAHQQLTAIRLGASTFFAKSGDVLSQLRLHQTAYEHDLSALEHGSLMLGQPSGQSRYRILLNELGGGALVIDHSLQFLDTRHALVQTIGSSLRNIQSGFPLLSLEWRHLSGLMVRTGAPRRSLARVESLDTRSFEINLELHALLNPGRQSTTRLKQFIANARYVDAVQRALVNGSRSLNMPGVFGMPALRSLLGRMEALYHPVASGFTVFLKNTSEVHSIFRRLAAVVFASHGMTRLMGRIATRMKEGVHYGIYRPIYGWVLLGAGLMLLLALLYVNYLINAIASAQRARGEEAQRNQSAILQLLDELAGLSDGDLTVQASVTEDITGAIADSVNFAVDQLRELVRTINQTAVQVDDAARRSRATATHVAQASSHQSHQIVQAGGQIAAMTKSIEQVSLNAQRSAEVAQRSVGIAHRGADAVRVTIEGMNAIRDTIQETAKRIKRLGESSQEIGDIVELINDIAEQTNILALNAAIQASMAGEAGRGFAVVADEVQRLAERAGNATRQIETLVKTIQVDTGEAVSSMEKSTAGVVNGAQLAENAGRALTEIETVSGHMANLVQSISEAAKQQAAASQNVTRTMNVIQEITVQTAEGTEATARDIGKLADLAGTLRQTVAGFKLPDESSGAEDDSIGAAVAGGHPPELHEEVLDLAELSASTT
ncbi:methyl-accepting chemotaxis sensory transducer [mine drainage metagenome]|uniref:Methyl-accepting chemotaxis sensory transducer n=1 Tax=mine drainage metagenome TaxID=410659 RepID=T1BTU9_9ZZZZ